MGFGILHLSDMHFKASGGARIVERAPAIVAAVRSRCTHSEALLVVISGDVSFSGKGVEFDRAGEFIDTLLEQLRAQTSLEVLGPVIIPGNHDCDFALDTDLRPSLLNNLPTELGGLNLQGQRVLHIVAPQDEFFVFEQKYSGTERKGISRLYYPRQFSFRGREILVHCFNTAWVSRLKEQQGQILYATHVETLKSTERPTLSISVFHHPYRWFEPTNGRQFQKWVEHMSDLVLTGHEHDGDYYRQKSSKGDQVSYIEGAALETAVKENGFNFIDIPLDEQRFQVSTFLWNGSIYEPSQEVTEDFIRNPRLSTEFFENNLEFERHLSQLGAAFSHPAKELEVDDIFIYPDLKVRSFFDKRGKLLSGEKTLEFVVSQRHLMVSGPPLSGKSTLTAKLYRDLHEKQAYVPILLSGKNIKGNPQKALSKAVQRAFQEQYSSERLESFIQLDPGKKALLVDDWHLSQLNTSGRKTFFAEATREFAIVVTLGADQSWMQDMLEAVDLAENSDFQYCDIRQLGYRLRGKLISKWHALGKEFETAEEEFTHVVNRDEHLLNTVVGKGLFPSYPFFVLYALQLSRVTAQSTMTHGSFGHVYEAFLTMRLTGVSKKSTDIGIKYTYLSLIAHKLFEGQKDSLSPTELSEVHNRFQLEYDIRTDQETMIHQLEDARILGHTGDSVGFLHKYCYYFFVANYFKKLVANAPGVAGPRKQLEEMADMIHDEEYMNILIFYIYLTEDRQLVEYTSQ